MLDHFNSFLTDIHILRISKSDKARYDSIQKSKARVAVDMASNLLNLWIAQHEKKWPNRKKDKFLKQYVDCPWKSSTEKRRNWIIEDWRRRYSTVKQQKILARTCLNIFWDPKTYGSPTRHSAVIHTLAACYFFFSYPEPYNLPRFLSEYMTAVLLSLLNTLSPIQSEFCAWLERDYPRLLRSSQTQKRKVAASKQQVLEAYHRTDEIKKDTKPYTAARIVHDRLERKLTKSPSIKTILRYLKEEKLVSKL
jgi:hypothetical protein